MAAKPAGGPRPLRGLLRPTDPVGRLPLRKRLVMNGQPAQPGVKNQRLNQARSLQMRAAPIQPAGPGSGNGTEVGGVPTGLDLGVAGVVLVAQSDEVRRPR